MNFSITFADEALWFGAALIEDRLLGLNCCIDGTDYKILGVLTRESGEVHLKVAAYNETTGLYDGEESFLVLYSPDPNAKEIKTIKVYWL